MLYHREATSAEIWKLSTLIQKPNRDKVLLQKSKSAIMPVTITTLEALKC